MTSPHCERAIEDALHHGNALLKFISPNDAGITGTHQCGYYLPKAVWRMFTPHPPVKGRVDKHWISVTWQQSCRTESVITWYGDKTRSEYRLTRFGHNFPFLNENVVGDLLVLIPRSTGDFIAWILNTDDDIEEIQSTLGVEAFESWGIYQNGVAQKVESEDECLDRLIRQSSATFSSFPAGEVFSETTRHILTQCLRTFDQLRPDDLLMRCCHTEYQLFQSVERRICQDEVSGRPFTSIDEFLQTAARIMNRRKARAGRSFENHVEHLLRSAGIPHKMRPSLGADGRPDVVIPDERAYFDAQWPENKLFVAGLKTTCKDRWRQVLNEGRRVRTRYIFTLQPGISAPQLKEMHTAGISLVVPQPLHKLFPKDTGIRLLGVDDFLKTIRQQLN